MPCPQGPVDASAEDAVKALLWCMERMQQIKLQCSQQLAPLLGQTPNETQTSIKQTSW